jgi:hypothetical protein
VRGPKKRRLILPQVYIREVRFGPRARLPTRARARSKKVSISSGSHPFSLIPIASAARPGGVASEIRVADHKS